MAINFDKFVEWAESRFKDVVVTDKEIKINSIFTSDDKHHLWCSPTGGRKEYKFGAFHCWKTNKGGDLIKLVRLVDNCSREEALSTLCGYKTIAQLEKDIDEFLGDTTSYLSEDSKNSEKSKFSLPSGSHLISDLGTNNWYRQKSEEYLTNRKIPIDGYYVCMEEPYKGRIVIPYYGKSGELIYWNSRSISQKSKLRYLGPPKSCGIGKEDVIYMAGKWATSGSIVHVCEGEFNAKSLQLSELNACACGGKNMSEKQAIMLSDYRIVVCLDRDKAGTHGTMKMLNMLSLSKNLQSNDKLMYVRPPEKYNDWNEMYIDAGTALVHNWIHSRSKSVDFSAPHGMAGDVVQFS